MSPLVLSRPHRRSPAASASTPSSRALAWRGETFLLAGGSLPLAAEEQQRRRRGLGIGMALEVLVALAVAACLSFGPPRFVTPAAAPLPLHLVWIRPAPPVPLLPPAEHYRVPATNVPDRLAAPQPLQPQPPVRLVPAPRLRLAAAAPRLPALRLPAPPAAAVKLGRFGDPHGIPARQATPVPAPVLGAFGRARSAPDPPAAPVTAPASTAGFGGPAAESRPAPPSDGASIHTGGFGTANAGDAGAAAAGTAAVHLHGFAAARPVMSTAPSPIRSAAPSWQAPEILSWPKPAYTAAAAQHHVQGEVLLQVRLGADGRATVLKLVQGLGYGLDQSAEAAAQQLRFRPAERAGQPVDWTVLLHIQFQLAD